MDIKVTSLYQVEKEYKQTNKRTALILITDGSDVDIKAGYPNPKIENVLKLHFSDVDYCDDNSYGIVVPPCAKDFHGLKKYIEKLKKRSALGLPEQLIVCCTCAISRSPGLAAALCDYFGIPNDFWTNKVYHANLLVYKLACDELGIHKTKEELDSLEKMRDEHTIWHPW